LKENGKFKKKKVSQWRYVWPYSSSHCSHGTVFPAHKPSDLEPSFMIKNSAGGKMVKKLLASSIQYLDLYMDQLNVPIIPIQASSMEYYVCTWKSFIK
jgi:hypothetical protein